MAPIELLNTLANPHIKVRCHPTKNTNRWSKNEYLDPEDDAHWDENDLTPVELGHVYRWKEDNDAWIHIFMPFKIMDRVTASLLNGIKTYRSTPPFVTGKEYALDRLARNPKSCLQTFKFTREYFSEFKTRVETIGGVLEKDEVNFVSLIEGIQSTRDLVSNLLGEVSSLREKYCVDSGETLDSSDTLQVALTSFSELRGQVSEAILRTMPLNKLLDGLRSESGRKTEYIQASEWFEQLKSELDLLRGVDFDRLEREVIHKHRRDSGQVDKTKKPPTLMSLEAELKNLKVFYKSLERLQASGDSISLDLSGVTIKLHSDGSIDVAGDPASLKAYVGGSVAIEKGSNRRRRVILAKGDE